MTTAVQTRTGTWTIDPTHSIAEFAVKHLVVTTVKGRFRDLEGTIQIDEARPENSSVHARIAATTIDTNQPERDAHLRSDDFLNAEKFPYITFDTTRVELIDDEHFRLIGNLTIRDVTREVALDGEYEGRVLDPWGGERAAFSAATAISRKEFNVRWNQTLESGGVVVADNVRITLHIEAIRQKED